MNEIIVNNLVIDPDSFEKAMRLHFKLRRKRSLALSFLTFISGIVLLLIGLLKSDVNVVIGLIALLYALFYMFGFVPFFIYLNKKVMYRRAKKIKNSYRMNIEGLEETLKGISTFYPWNKFKKAIFQNDIILLYRNSYGFRIFSQKNYSISEFTQIKEWIKNKVKVISIELER